MVTLLGALVRASGVPCVARCASASGLAAVPSCSWQSEWRCLHSSTAAAQGGQRRQKSKRMRTAYNFWQSDEHKPRDDKSGDVVPWRDLSASLKKRYTQRVEQSKSSAETLQTILNTISLLDATRGTLATKVASEGTNGKRNRQQTARTSAKAARAVDGEREKRAKNKDVPTEDGKRSSSSKRRSSRERSRREKRERGERDGDRKDDRRSSRRQDNIGKKSRVARNAVSMQGFPTPHECTMRGGAGALRFWWTRQWGTTGDSGAVPVVSASAHGNDVTGVSASSFDAEEAVAKWLKLWRSTVALAFDGYTDYGLATQARADPTPQFSSASAAHVSAEYDQLAQEERQEKHHVKNADEDEDDSKGDKMFDGAVVSGDELPDVASLQRVLRRQELRRALAINRERLVELQAELEVRRAIGRDVCTTDDGK